MRRASYHCQQSFNTGLSRSSDYLRIADGSFPKQVSLGPRAVGCGENPGSDVSNERHEGVFMPFLREFRLGVHAGILRM